MTDSGRKNTIDYKINQEQPKSVLISHPVLNIPYNMNKNKTEKKVKGKNIIEKLS